MANVYYYPPGLQSEDKYPAYMSFEFMERKDPTKSTLSDIVYLYMPERASQPSTVSWENEKFGFVGKHMAQSVSGVAGGNINLDAALDAAYEGAQVAAQRMGGNVGAKIANMLGGQVSAEGLAGEVTGQIPNPYLTMVFRGVDFRNFGYTFRFFPFKESDCKVIDDIVKTFRGFALPPGEGSSGAGVLGYPKEVQISYKWMGEDNMWLHRFKRAVITGVDVDYTPNSMFSVMRNGFPTCIEMNLKLTEIEIVLRDDVLEKGY